MTEQSQLRGLARYGAALCVAGAALTAIWWWGGRAGLVGAWAVGLDLAAVLALYAWAAFRGAYSEFSPAGIRTRGLIGTRTVPWDRVRGVVLRPAQRTVTLVVVRDRGRAITLGAPVHGGVMKDPDFGRKVEQIQAYVDQVGGTDRARADRPVGPETGPTAAGLGRPTWAERLRSAVWWVILPALAAAMLLYVGSTLPSEIQAARGAGTPGSFLVYDLPCRPSGQAGRAPRCSVVGAFGADDGSVLRDRQRLRGAPSGLRIGDTVRAQWVSVISSDVYTVPYSSPWYAEAGAGLISLLGLGWWVRRLRIRWRRRAARRRTPAQAADGIG